MKKLFLFGMLFVLVACREEAVETEPPVRGLKTHTVVATKPVSVRRYPAVLEAADMTMLSFEVSGKLDRITLAVGQRVKEGETLATLDPASLNLAVDTARSNVLEAEATARNAKDNAERQEELFSRGSVTKVVADDARTQSDVADASLVEARISLQNALDNLDKATLVAPFDGIVNSVQVDSFSTISATSPVVQFYPSDSFEVSFSVNFDSVSRLLVGKSATIRLADRPDIVLDAVVSEIGSRADAVSSFPIVLKLRDAHPILRAGMAVEASMEFELPADEGFTVPLSAIINDGKAGSLADSSASSGAGVFVFDATSGTVVRRDVSVGGIRGNYLVVTEGLKAGEKIASAGVSFLREGQKVKLLDGEG